MSTNATLPQAGHILTLIDQKGVTKGQITQGVSDGTLPDFFEAMAAGTVPSREELRNFLGLPPFVCKIVIDYLMTLEEMIVAGGYDWKHDAITSERFPLSGEGKVERIVELIHFNRTISSDEVERELDKMGLRPATIEELLAFGATFPETQRKSSIVALGSCLEVHGESCVACLSGTDSDRGIGLSDLDRNWGGMSRFLAVRK